MDLDHLLKDVFEQVLHTLQMDWKASHQPTEIQKAIDDAEKIVIEQRVALMSGSLRSKRRVLYQMAEEWDKTRKPVKPRWASVKDPAWKV